MHLTNSYFQRIVCCIVRSLSFETITFRIILTSFKEFIIAEIAFLETGLLTEKWCGGELALESVRLKCAFFCVDVFLCWAEHVEELISFFSLVSRL